MARFSHFASTVMSPNLQNAWRRFRDGTPGKRFEQRYRASRASGGALKRTLSAAVGVLLIGAGAVLLAIPGPGLLVIAFGAALIGQESLWVARVLDRLELAGRAIARDGRRWWKKTPIALRVGAVVAILVILAGAGLGAYRLLCAN